MDASKPTTTDGREYHLQTLPGDIARYCLLVGSPERAEMIAKTFFTDPELVGDHRGLKSYTGKVAGIPMSVVTTGMGGASAGIVLPEAIRSGGRVFIRVGSCSTLWKEPKPGDSAICTGAVRLDGVAENWAMIQYPAVPDFRVVAALARAAKELGLPHYLGYGATTGCFGPGQNRKSLKGYISPLLKDRHEELQVLGVLFYSMEETIILILCSINSTQEDPLLAGAVDAIYGNRQTNEFAVCGDEEAAQIAILAMRLLYADGI